MDFEELFLTLSSVLMVAGFSVLSWRAVLLSYRYAGWLGVGFCLIGLGVFVFSLMVEPPPKRKRR